LLNAAENLLKMVNELKHTFILSDFETINTEITRRTIEYKNQQETTEKLMLSLNRDIDEALYELEAAYYSSQYKNLPQSEIL